MPNPEYTQPEVDNLFGLQASQIAADVQRIAKLEAAVAAIQGSTTTPTPPAPVPPPVAGVPFPTSSWSKRLPVSGLNYAPLTGFSTGGGWCNRDSYSVPLIVSKATDPIVTVNVPSSWGWPAGQIQLRVPVDVTGSPGTDGSIAIIDGTMEYNFWQFSRNGATASCTAWAKGDIATGTGWGKNGQAAGIHATGSSLYAGLIVGNELSKGINHALAVTLGKGLTGSNFVGEAIASDGEGGSVPEGARLAIPRTIGPPPLMTVQGRNLWTAFQEFGGFVIDKAPGDGHAILLIADPRSVPDADLNAIIGPNWTAADLAAIAPQLRRVL